MASANVATLPPDAVIGGKYRVLRVLGSGGMGAVYEAENTWTKRHVAVKLMHPEANEEPDYARRFTQEAQSAGRLSHENVVEVLDMGKDPDNKGLFIVYEFMEGEDLRHRLHGRGRLGPREALMLLTPVMEALVVVHGHGIVHRDLKPENIFLAETARGITPKIIDFGIAKVTAPDLIGAVRTATGEMIGTPSYMSPEQVTGEADIDARADVWSIAVVLYECLSGQRPFTADSVGMFVTEVLTGRPRPLDQACPGLPPSLVKAVHGALLPRDQRYPSMQAFLDVLDDVRPDLPVTTDASLVDEVLFDLSVDLSVDKRADKAAPPPSSLAETVVEARKPTPAVTPDAAPDATPWPRSIETPAARRTELSARWISAALAVVVVVVAVVWWRSARPVHPPPTSAAPTPARVIPVTPVTPVEPPPMPVATPVATPVPPTPVIAPVIAPVAAPVVAHPLRHRRARPDAGSTRAGPTFAPE